MSVHPLPPPKPETNASLMRPDISPHRPEISPQLEKMRAYKEKVYVFELERVGWDIGCGWGLVAPAHLSITIL